MHHWSMSLITYCSLCQSCQPPCSQVASASRGGRGSISDGTTTLNITTFSKIDYFATLDITELRTLGTTTLNIKVLSVVMLNVVLLSVVAPMTTVRSLKSRKIQVKTPVLMNLKDKQPFLLDGCGTKQGFFYPVGFLLIWQPCFMWQCSK